MVEIYGVSFFFQVILEIYGSLTRRRLERSFRKLPPKLRPDLTEFPDGLGGSSDSINLLLDFLTLFSLFSILSVEPAAFKLGGFLVLRV